MSSTRACPGPLSDASPHERAARWDELLPEEVNQLARHPEIGPALDLLQRAEAWLAGGAESAPCPAPEALYEYASGPGAAPLAERAHAQVRGHLLGCPSCAEFVETLAAPVPEDLLEGARPAPGGRLLRFAPLAAAALVLVVGVQFGAWNDRGANAAWPTGATLRGSADAALLAPRGRCLAGPDAPWAGRPTFELEPLEGATHYRIEVRRHAGEAFERGALALELESGAPLLSTPTALPAGHYTWEAWYTLDGVERPLGACDFRVVDGPAPRAAAGVETVRALHEAGWLNDARAAARALPAGPERDAYLARPSAPIGSPGPAIRRGER